MGNHQSRLSQPGCFRGQLIQLDQQAFLQITGEHAGWIEVLQAMKNGFHFVQFQRVFVGFVHHA